LSGLVSTLRSDRGTALARVAVVVVGTFLVHAVFAFLVGNRGWDDGPITVAFADTFAHTGRIALTPHSEIVEGFSSPLWFMLLAGIYRLFPLSFDGMILASQLLSGLFAALGAAILFDLLRPFLPRAAMPLSIAVFGYATFLLETANGMEMSALSALTLAIVRLIREPRPHGRALLAVAALVPWLRFEASGYVIAGAVAMIVLARDYRRARALLFGTGLSLLVLEAARFAIFGSLVANTILAKRWAVYAPGSLRDQIQGAVVELAHVVAPGVLVLVLGVLGVRIPIFRGSLTRLQSRTTQPAVAYIVGYVLGVAAFNLAIGYNSGYPGRMAQSAVALVVILAVYCAPRAVRSLDSPPRLAAFLLTMLALTCFGIFHGDDRMSANWPLGRWDGTTPVAFRQTGQAADEVRTHLGLATMSVLLADVGGSSLCCKQLEILDLALLANRELARDGYGAFGQYLEKHKPDVIATHEGWSEVSRIYEQDYFRRAYVPVVVQGRWLYVRKDHFARLASDCSWITLDAAKPSRTTTGEGAIDKQYVETLGRAYVCQLR
jgi:hypothetical protein